jgi:ATP-binding cassette subfamily B protein
MRAKAATYETHRVTWFSRLAYLRNVRLLLSLVWQASPVFFSLSIFLRICRAIVPVANLWISKLILDTIILIVIRHSRPVGTLWRLVVLDLAISVASDILTRLANLTDSMLADHFATYVNVRIMEHAIKLDLASFESPQILDKMERARRQSSGRLALLTSLMNCFQDVLSLTLLSSGLILFSPWLLLLLVGSVLPAFFGETQLMALEYSALFRHTPERRKLDYIKFISASAQAVKEVKIFGLGDYLLSTYRQISTGVMSENKRVAIRRASLSSLLALISNTGSYCGYIMILLSVLRGSISIGSCMFLSRTFFRAQMFVERIFSNIGGISDEAVQIKDLFEFLDTGSSICSRPGARLLPKPMRRGIEFRNVSFSYPGSERWTIRNVSFHIGPSEKIALVGGNGAGKTTLVKLLSRLYDPTEGEILLDGVDLREYDLEDFRHEISVIFQDYMRYDLRVRENLGFGNIECMTDEIRLESAARKSLAMRMINQLPSRFDQVLGQRFEGGVELSMGEWQKLALARAYMRDAQLIILDEPTASLDARAEYEMYRKFVEHTRDRMAILISHRFSTVRMADRILVLGNGSIQEDGTHAELLAIRGRYAEIFELQARAYH